MEVRVHLERLVIRKLSGTITPLQICRLEETIQEQRAADLDISSPHSARLPLSSSFGRIDAQ